MPGPESDGVGQQGNPATPTVVNITGNRVALGPFRRDLIPLYHRWFNDFAVRRTRVRAPRPTTLEAQEREYDALATAPDRLFFTVWDTISMDCLAGEFVSPVLGHIFVPDEPKK